MRELIYLSETKLRSFADERRPRWWSKVAEMEASVPNIIQVGVKAKTGEKDRDHRLNQIVADLGRRGGAAAEFHDRDVTNGQWVHFENEFSRCIVEDAGLHSTVIFLNRPRYYPDGAQPPVRLLLHGSVNHLLNHADEQLLKLPRVLRLPYAGSAPEGFRTQRVEDFIAISEALRGAGADLATLEGARGPGAHSEKSALESYTQRLVLYLDNLADPAVKTPMSGYARVTFVGATDPNVDQYHRLVCATPLFVQYGGRT